MDFIFMLTRNDRTIPDASDRLQEALALGIRHIGFKDIGLPVEALKELNAAIRAGGATSYLEVVSLDEASELTSARMAVEIGVDVLLGGTRAEAVLPIIAGTGIRYFPFPGRVTGHPSVLEGPAEDIVASARRLVALPGVAGLDLLAWRFQGDVPGLIAKVAKAAGKPVIVAGSIDGETRIRQAHLAGAAAFTIGTAALDGHFKGAAPDLPAQLSAILMVTARIAGRICPNRTVDLAAAQKSVAKPWTPVIAGQLGEMDIKLARFEGAFVWHHHDEEDELFLVTRGRMAMHFRDRTEWVGPGQFLIVPRGVEHCPEALGGPCDVLLMEPSTTLNTGNVQNDRTVRDLATI
ncbi:cupin domain-containing protein [Pseudooceanicola sp. C21-150M6]|uniref:cupin domain-containing protein n=1 Tax=Pseudooceanicola sp. C21-150M6 TaxID=3434355 RepID=UPI003D7FFB0C